MLLAEIFFVSDASALEPQFEPSKKVKQNADRFFEKIKKKEGI